MRRKVVPLVAVALSLALAAPRPAGAAESDDDAVRLNVESNLAYQQALAGERLSVTVADGGLRMFTKFGADGVNPFKGIMMQEYSHDRKKLIGEPKLIFTGTKLGVTEGPHIYKHGGYYHLMTAEGGTGRDHAVTTARSRAIDGPYEVHPDNPLLTSRGRRGLALQRAGHGSLVVTTNHDWYLAHLCARPVRGTRHYRCPLGRESALQKVTWGADGWLRLESGGRYPELTVTAPDLPDQPWPSRPARDEFNSPELSLEYQALRVPLGDDTLSLGERPGFPSLFVPWSFPDHTRSGRSPRPGAPLQGPRPPPPLCRVR